VSADGAGHDRTSMPPMYAQVGEIRMTSRLYVAKYQLRALSG
jgi:hypothetical protein